MLVFQCLYEVAAQTIVAVLVCVHWEQADMLQCGSVAALKEYAQLGLVHSYV
jgi:hypothetical protein